MKTFKHLNHLKWREGRGFAERRSFVLRKERKEERGREKKGESKGAAYFLKFELNISSVIWRFKFKFRPLIIYLKSVFIDLVSNFGIFVDFNWDC